MLAVTLTNHYSGVLAETALHTMFQGFVVCMGFEPTSLSRKLSILTVRLTDHFFSHGQTGRQTMCMV